MPHQVRSLVVQDGAVRLSSKRHRIMNTLTSDTDSITNSCSADQKLTRSKLYSRMLRSRSSTCEYVRCSSTDLRKLLLTRCVDVCNAQNNKPQTVRSTLLSVSSTLLSMSDQRCCLNTSPVTNMQAQHLSIFRFA